MKSISEFQKLYFNACVARKAALKKANERPRRSHMGLIIHVFSHNESTETVSVGKMNFVDLAGYNLYLKENFPKFFFLDIFYNTFKF